MADVVVDEVTKSFGRTEVLKGISVAIADGEMLVILGSSGCGKSTLLRLIAGLDRVTSGSISIGGRRVNELEPKDRDIAMVFQTYALYPHMTVYDNMAYGLRNQGVAKPEIDERVREAAGILGLAQLLERRPRQLSGGQRQRVAMGRAIVREPAVFLFDEPLSNLDAKLRLHMRHEIRQLQQRLGTTGIYVTHDQVEAMTLGDRLMLLDAGRVAQIGTPLDLYAHPADLFVAGFIGSPPMNILDGSIDESGQTVEVGTARLALAGPLASMAGRPVKVGLRPEHLRQGGDAAPIRFKVDWLEALGADTVVFGSVDAGQGGEQALTLRLGDVTPPRPGAELRLEVDPARLHLFDDASGVRLPV